MFFFVGVPQDPVHYKIHKKSHLIQSYMDLRSDNFMGSVGGADQIRNSHQNEKFGLLRHTPENVDGQGRILFFFQLNFDIFLVRILQSGRQPRSIRRTEKFFLAKNHFRVLCFDFRRSQIVTNFCHLEKKYSRKNVKQLTRQDKVVEQQQ